MKRLGFGSILVLSGLLCGTASCSEESIHYPYKVSLWADTGQPFGDVGATLERTRPERDRRIRYRVKAIQLIVNGKEFDVPQADLEKMLAPRMDTAQIRTGGAMDGGSPWLYLVFRLAALNSQKRADDPIAYIEIRDGKLQGTHIWPMKDNVLH